MIDYKAGNLTTVVKALGFLDARESSSRSRLTLCVGPIIVGAARRWSTCSNAVAGSIWD